MGKKMAGKEVNGVNSLSLGVAHYSGHFAHFLLLGITFFRGRRKKSCPALDWRGKDIPHLQREGGVIK